MTSVLGFHLCLPRAFAHTEWSSSSEAFPTHCPAQAAFTPQALCASVSLFPQRGWDSSCLGAWPVPGCLLNPVCAASLFVIPATNAASSSSVPATPGGN